MGYSGAGGKLIHKKTRSKKSRDTVPLKGLSHELDRAFDDINGIDLGLNKRRAWFFKVF